MGADFDEGSFKKARSFLLVFSSLLLVLWYFKAEMSTLSILGNSIKFTANTHDTWLLLSVANAYFFFRFVQHLPPKWADQGETATKHYERTLIRITQVLYRRANTRSAMEHFDANPEHQTSKDVKIYPTGYMDYQVSQGPTGEMDGDPRSSVVRFTLRCTYKAENGNLCTVDGYLNRVMPHRLIIHYSRVAGFIKNLFLSPWFTEHIFPMLFALSATGVGLWSWWEIH